MLYSAFPEPQGLYDPDNESDSCGVAMITDIQGRRSHAIVVDGLVALAAASAECILLSCDRRAAPTYAALGVTFELL